MTMIVCFLVGAVRLGLPVQPVRVRSTWCDNSSAAKNLRTPPVFLAPPISGTALPPRDISAIRPAFRLALEK